MQPLCHECAHTALHPTVLPTIGYPNAKPYKFLTLPAEERSEAATHELNYSDSSFLIGEAPDGDTAASLLRYVADIKGHAPALPHIQVHYEQTSRALERMALEQADYVEEDFDKSDADK
jgi:hypothetical protein